MEVRRSRPTFVKSPADQTVVPGCRYKQTGVSSRRSSVWRPVYGIYYLGSWIHFCICHFTVKGIDKLAMSDPSPNLQSEWLSLFLSYFSLINMSFAHISINLPQAIIYFFSTVWDLNKPQNNITDKLEWFFNTCQVLCKISPSKKNKVIIHELQGFLN